MKVGETDSQLTLQLEPGVSDLWGSLREFVQHRAHTGGRQMKWIAAEMDLSPSQLSRKLAESPNDSARLTVGDLERFIEVTGDTSPIAYLAEKYLAKRTDERIQALEAEIERLRMQAA